MDLERSLRQLDDTFDNRNLIRNYTRQGRDELMDFDYSRRQFDQESIFTSASVYGSHTNVSVIVKQKTDHLYQHFLSVIQARSNEMEIFDTVFDLGRVLEQTIGDMEHEKSMKVPKNSWIRQEMNTWSLIHCLYKDRVILQNEDMDTDLPLVSSEKVIVENLYASE